jgi:hypothetical protein
MIAVKALAANTAATRYVGLIDKAILPRERWPDRPRSAQIREEP